ncbi:TadE family protein [Photobacterium sp. TLY01]|uniref:TadE family protein n=1 Tax=Photobacterium sp. TLY01 TaxID=2907534 RepID=UPI001F1A3825|nr:TadE family protein [Photobacterium sp. TLY01]UIP30449.1 pilus assembly protein [Photobacterium sp. TLY01]
MDSIRKNRFRIKRIKQQGSAALETIFLLPVILMIFYAVAQYSLIFVSIQMLNYVSEEALRKSISYVDENCYYGGACDNTELKNHIRGSAESLIRNYTDSNSGYGSLFGQSLDGNLSINIDSDTFCCKVTIIYNYKNKPFLPSFGLPVPDELKSTAILNL